MCHAFPEFFGFHMGHLLIVNEVDYWLLPVHTLQQNAIERNAERQIRP